MAEYGEWNRKRATLSDVTATKEYRTTPSKNLWERLKSEYERNFGK